jgi:hypothetical protein
MDKRRCRCRLPARSRWTNCWLTRPKRASLGPAAPHREGSEDGFYFRGSENAGAGMPQQTQAHPAEVRLLSMSVPAGETAAGV